MRKIKSQIISLIVTVVIGLFQQTQAAQVTKVESIDNANQKAILYYVNEYRAKRGLKPLQLDSLMSAEAAKHSRDMARHAIPFGHKNFDKRIKRLYAQIRICRAGSENVAYNYKDGKM